jgi:hypothetical protein
MSKPLSRLLTTLLIAALPQPYAHAQAHAASALPAEDAPLLLSTDPAAERFKPVGKLSAFLQCTATLIAGAHPPASSTPALILTAGHCAGRFGANDVQIDVPAPGTWAFTPAYFIDTRNQHQSFRVRRTVYATMKGVDLAVMELDATYGDLANLGVHPMRLYATQPTPTTAIQIAHVPIVGIPVNEQFMRLSNCYADTRRPIFEGFNPWLWNEAVPHICQGIRGGSSGSPVVLQNQVEVIGVLNTTVAPQYIGCGPDRPCELEGKAGLVREGVSYYIPVDTIAQALSADGSLDLSKLDAGDGAKLTRSGGWQTQSTVADAGGGRKPAPWNLTIGEETQQIRYKTGLAQSTDCADAAGYGDPLDAGGQPLKDLELPPAEGIYKICVIGKQVDQSEWQPPDHATVMLHQIDDTPPTLGPRIVVSETNDLWLVGAEAREWEVVTRTIKYGPPAQTDCNDPSGYVTPLLPFEALSKNQTWRFCARGVDGAGNPTPIVYQDFGG